MTHIQIDSTTNHIFLELELKGETAPLRVEIKSYRLGSDSGDTFIEIGAVETSREWINALLDDYCKETRGASKCRDRSKRCFESIAMR